MADPVPDTPRATERLVYKPPALTGRALHDWAQRWENQWGYDSMDTIEAAYERSKSGAFKCVWPNCAVARKYVEDIWLHVHFAPAHVRKRKELDAVPDTIRLRGWSR